jgi:amidohydrolase
MMAVSELVQWRRDLHQIPELAFQEEETAAYCQSVLEGMGLDVERPVGTALTAEIEGRGPGPTIALRADMDGLPLHEDTGEPFSSRHDGVMHACGHDAHMAILLGTAKRLVNRRDFPGRVRLLFQPSEERPPGGAPALIAHGALERVDGVLGLHVWASYPVGTAAMRAGVMMANSDRFRITVHGRGGHGSEPDTAKDAVVIASQIVVNLQTIVSRRVTPLEACVVTAGTIAGGATFNIIAETAEITGTVRTLTAETQKVVETELVRIAEHTAAMHDASVTVEYMRGYPAVVNHAPVVAAWRDALAGLVTVVEPPPSMGGEDFAYYLQERPGAFLFLGARPSGEQFPHHSPHFRLSEDCLPLGVEVLERGARLFLAHPERLKG